MLAMLPVLGPAIVKAATASKARLRYLPFVPSEFPKWDRATDGLESGWKWAADLERSSLPRDLVFPQTGQVWEAVRDCEVSFQTSIPFARQPPTVGVAMPFSTRLEIEAFMKYAFGTTRLHRGERVRVLDVGEPKPLQVDFVPVRYEELEAEMIPEETRRLTGYNGYVLHLRTARTIGDFKKDNPQIYFTEAFRIIRHAA